MQSQLDKKASVDELKTQVSSIEASLADAKSTLAATKTTAEAALEAAKKAEADAKTSGDAAAEAAAAAKKAAAEVELKAAEAKEAAIKAAEEKVAALQKEIEASVNASLEQIQQLAAKVEAAAAEAMSIVGHRLSSIALIPTKHVNGIAAITVNTLKYTPQVYAKMAAHAADPSRHANRPVLDHVAVPNAKVNYISSNTNEVKYHMNPSLGVTKDDILLPSFDCIVSENTSARAVKEEYATNNSPIMPVPGQDINIKDGVLTVLFQRHPDMLHETIGTEGFYDTWGETEKFYMASLKVPVAEKNWTEAEKKAGVESVNVNSEYDRISEIVRVPYLVHSKTDFTKAIGNDFADEVQTVAGLADPIYVHYHDSICLYESNSDELVDIKWSYNKELNLKEWVKVCATVENPNDKHNAHIDLKDYADYGLEFRFTLAKAKYLQGTRNTDEQEFATIDDAKNGIMKSRVYTVGGSGDSRASIGREPVVRVSLIDTKNGNALIAQRYIKVQWTETQAPEQTLAPVTFSDDIVSCWDMFQQMFTQDVNEKIYHEVKLLTDGGGTTNSISKENFHKIYTRVTVLDLKKDGTSILLDKDGKPTLLSVSTNPKTTWNEGSKKQEKDGWEDITSTDDVVFGFLEDATDGNMSYNLVWAMTPKTVGTIKDAKSSKFEISVQYEDPTGVHGAIKQTFIQNIVIPAQQFAYQGTYWKNGVGAGTFNVNPIVYDTKLDGAVTTAHNAPTICALNDYSHIEADLVNGYINTLNKKAKPANLAQFIQYIRGCAKVNFLFDDAEFGKYEHLAGYSVNEAKTQLWKIADPKNITDATVDTEVDYLNGHKDFTDKKILDYIQVGHKDIDLLAASINNNLGADAVENQKNLKWDIDETLGSGNNECHSVIRLHEKDNLNATAAAKEMVGKAVPVKLTVEYNAYNVVDVQKFEVFFIDPLTVDGKIGENFVDAVVNGSFLSVAKNFTFTDWNGYSVASAVPTKPTEKQQYAHDLFDYYAVKSIVFDSENTTTSLKYDEATSTYKHTEGVKTGAMPYGHMLKQMNWAEADEKVNDKTKATEVASNPSHLAYFNENGTPVNVDYKMYVDVKVEYKWKTLEKKGLEITVKKAEGTPSGSN